MTKALKLQLIEGNEYIIRLKPNPGSFCKGSGFDNNGDYERISNHKFFLNRKVIFMGYDKEWMGECESFIFCDKHIKLYENLKEKDDYDAFMQMTFICISGYDDDYNWVFHIVKDNFEINE